MLRNCTSPSRARGSQTAFDTKGSNAATICGGLLRSCRGLVSRGFFLFELGLERPPFTYAQNAQVVDLLGQRPHLIVEGADLFLLFRQTFSECLGSSIEGILQYRGIDVTDLVAGSEQAGRFGFEETAFLLLFGYLPNARALDAFSEYLGQSRALPEGFTENMMLKAPSKDVMNKLARSVLAAYSYDENPDDTCIENVLRQSMELIVRFPTMVAYGFQAKQHYYEKKSPIFAISRIAGWCAHRVEELVSGGRIIRPAYKNLTKRRAYIPIGERS